MKTLADEDKDMIIVTQLVIERFLVEFRNFPDQLLPSERILETEKRPNRESYGFYLMEFDRLLSEDNYLYLMASGKYDFNQKLFATAMSSKEDRESFFQEALDKYKKAIEEYKSKDRYMEF